MSYLTKPKIRLANFQRTVHNGQPVFLMHDSLGLTDAAILLPQALGPLVILCDGLNTVDDVRSRLAGQYGIELPNGTLNHLLQQFDEALLLEGGRFEEAKQKLITTYRGLEFRQPALAGSSYPADPDELRQMLQGYVDQLDDLPTVSATSRAILSPHIDYQRGGPVYAAVWASAAEAIREAELVIIFATDHNGGFGTLTFTPQHYASPLGIMPTDIELVNRLANQLGPTDCFAEELHHINEWSIELVLVWLQFIRQGKPCPTLPILCGSFHQFIMGQADLQQEDRFNTMTDILREEMSQRRTVVVASGDLAHMGPAFDGPALDAAAHTQMKADDDILIETLTSGQANSFFTLMKKEQYHRNVCGLSPFYFTLNLLEKSRGHLIRYDRCPADHNNTSFVSVCGVVLE